MEIFEKGSTFIGTDGTEVILMSRVSKRGFAKVKVSKVGSHMLLRTGQVVEGFQLTHGIVKFEGVSADA